MFVIDLHSENARRPMFVTESGISMFSSFKQDSNAQSSISVIEFGITIFVRDIQFENARKPMIGAFFEERFDEVSFPMLLVAFEVTKLVREEQ